ncbi:putative zinc-binding metallopeptidase [Rhizobium sp. TRM95111]|uniref:zinc-binding metallopeptidase family protein n=1 Tax=Rhizobium alarense TaxID=2846851 RepID=UPI001F2455EC|nr:putative zinc-binding metallopeptidase [Rhizobium alarense]MCF3640145.1 putative zinc-binding metallopeptidase [Rhizobium alarense]
MKLFRCANCDQTIHFDNRQCIRCGAMLGFRADDVALHALVPVGGDRWQVTGDGPQDYRFCHNAAIDVCNWLVPAEGAETLCVACRHNRIVPMTDPQGRERWRRICQAQRHLFYSLLRWNLPRPTRAEQPEGGLVFDFLADEVDANGAIVPAMTGHEDGLISLRAAEADDVVREGVRVSMNEPYRSLLGHFRHEIGHFYWTQLVRDEATLAEARRLFGDEREDYATALQRNYEQGPPPDWRQHFISTYASCHPAEDFAECWAHFFHIVDTLETARAFGLNTDPKGHEELEAEVTFDPYRAPDAGRLVEAWVPLSVVMNAIQRSMGQPDSYPFVLPPPVVAKLDFINRMVLL